MSDSIYIIQSIKKGKIPTYKIQPSVPSFWTPVHFIPRSVGNSCIKTTLHLDRTKSSMKITGLAQRHAMTKIATPSLT